MRTLAPFMPLYMIIGLIAIAGLVFRSAWFKGWIGELIVHMCLKWGLNEQEYRLFRNVTIPTEDGTTQIDHIIVSRLGVFVIETKNMKGWIFGSERDAYWTQTIYKKKVKFQNPLRQNYKHTQTLTKILDLPSNTVISVIIFIGGSDFKTEMPPNVFEGWSFIRYIRSFSDPVLTDQQVRTVISEIGKQRLAPGLRTHINHIRHVKQIVAEKEKPITCPEEAGENPPVCPKCGGEMALREARNGSHTGKQFWGCIKFPRCRGVVSYSSK